MRARLQLPFGLALLALCTTLAACSTNIFGTQQQRANVGIAAVLTCTGAQIAAAATVSITQDVNTDKPNAGSIKDAQTAQAITAHACDAVTKLATVAASIPDGTTVSIQTPQGTTTMTATPAVATH